MKPIVFSDSVEKALQREANEQLASTWCWMKEILDTLEDQLNVGDSFDTKVVYTATLFFCLTIQKNWRKLFNVVILFRSEASSYSYSRPKTVILLKRVVLITIF